MPPVAKKLKKPIEKVKEKSISDTVENEEIKGEDVISSQLQKKLDKNAKKFKKRPERGVLLVRHLPHGFFEEQLKKYFEQFGLVTRLRLARSRKTGNTKGFAFIEFATPDVAKIAAEAMNNYLMFKKIVQTHYIPPEEQKYNYFKSGVKKVTTHLGKDIYISGKTKLARYKVKQNNIWNQFNYAKRTNNSIKKLNKLKKKYADLGLNLDDITIAPKLLPAEAITKDENVDDDNKTLNISNEQSEDNVEPGSLLLVKKRKRISKQKENLKIPKLSTSTDKNNLKQLLDETLEDESEDEDYVPDSSEETPELITKSTNKKELKQLLDQTLEEESSSEDEDYISDNSEKKKLKDNFLKELKEIAENVGSDSNNTDSTIEETDLESDNQNSEDILPKKKLIKLLDKTLEEESSSEDEDYIPHVESDSNNTDSTIEETDLVSDNQNSEHISPIKKGFAKSTKPEKTADNFEKIIRRTTHFGGIQKKKNKGIKSKPVKKSTAFNVIKEKMKTSAAKELLKSNKIQKFKNIDLKKKK